MRLFVVNRNGKPVGGKHPTYYGNKSTAKVNRDEFGGVEAGFTIGLAPDHIGKHGNHNPHRRNK